MADLDVKGYLKITKQFKDGTKEIVLDDHNTIVSGMGLGFVYLFSLSGSTSVLDYHLDRYQVGISGTSAFEVSTTYQLSSPLSSILEYTGEQGLVPAIEGVHLTNNSVTATEIFVKIMPSQVTRISDNTVRYSFMIDSDSCNDLSRSGQEVKLNEIGLYMRNPSGFVTADRSVLVAYRSFNPLRKTDEFDLLFDWTITF